MYKTTTYKLVKCKNEPVINWNEKIISLTTSQAIDMLPMLVCSRLTR